MKIYDISVTVPFSPAFPGDPEVKLERTANIKDGAVCNLTVTSMCLHAGTHVDAPLHFLDGGDSIESMSPKIFIGDARVVTVYKNSGDIETADLEGQNIKSGARLLLKTRNSLDGHVAEREFYTDYCALAPSAAEYLVQCGVKLVGIDYASIGQGDSNPITHKTLLGAGIAVLEWLDLREVTDGEYFLSAAPIKIAGAEGSPSRALLIEF